jgi:hypothetical protein
VRVERINSNCSIRTKMTSICRGTDLFCSRVVSTHGRATALIGKNGSGPDRYFTWYGSSKTVGRGIVRQQRKSPPLSATFPTPEATCARPHSQGSPPRDTTLPNSPDTYTARMLAELRDASLRQGTHEIPLPDDLLIATGATDHGLINLNMLRFV